MIMKEKEKLSATSWCPKAVANVVLLSVPVVQVPKSGPLLAVLPRHFAPCGTSTSTKYREGCSSPNSTSSCVSVSSTMTSDDRACVPMSVCDLTVCCRRLSWEKVREGLIHEGGDSFQSRNTGLGQGDFLGME